MNLIQNKGLKRNSLDKYYTKPTVVTLCLDFFTKNIPIDPSDLIIEPSAGNGAFISAIKLLSPHVLFYDIAPEHADIIQCDYLTLDTTTLLKKEFNKNKNKIHVIGNPPFGRQSSLAIKFIKKSCEFCDTLAFILPKSFKKDSLKKTFPLSFHLIFENDLPDKSFLVNGEEYTVDSVFQIWQKKDHPRCLVEKSMPLNFIFVNKAEYPDISFRRVGVYAGKIDKNSVDKSVQSHYFIKFTTTQNVDAIVALLSSSIKFNHNNTVGPRSISKPELISEFNKYL